MRHHPPGAEPTHPPAYPEAPSQGRHGSGSHYHSDRHGSASRGPPEEIREILGDEIAGHYRVINHNAREPGEHKSLGRTASGTPVSIDSRFIDADLHITVGLIEPHLMAGYSGGRKLIAPGLAEQETIKVLHSPRFMRGQYAVEGSMSEILCTGSCSRSPPSPAMISCATWHLRGVGHLRRIRRQPGRGAPPAGVHIPRAHGNPAAPVDAVITTAAGYPLDLTFYQAIKGVTAAAHIVRPGGRILLVAACKQGPEPAFSRNAPAGSRSWEDFLRAFLMLP